jgi:hypothetical protein
MLDLVEEVRNLGYSVRATRTNLMQKYPNWDELKDARLGFFSRYINVIESTRLALYFQEKELKSRSWWTNNFPKSKSLTDDELSIYIEEFDRTTKIGFLQTEFSAIETAFRTYVKAIDPTACSNGTANFDSIYSWLFKCLGLLGRGFDNLLDLLREIRNTVHNNGVYFSSKPNRQNITISYKGKDYHFDTGQGIAFGTWEFYFSLVPDVVQMVIDIVESDEVSSMQTINDPFALSFPSIQAYTLLP